MSIGDEELAPLGKVGILLLLALAAITAAFHIATGQVPTPGAFWITGLGFALFASAKIAVIARGRWISFGTGAMSDGVANLYRAGYWLMILGVLVTFGG